MRSVAVVVQACPAPGRPGWEQVRAAIEASDIGYNYRVCFQSPNRTIREHFLDTLRSGASLGRDLVLRLEDDVDVNQYILENLVNWPALDDDRFGLGWAFDPGGSAQSGFDRKHRRVVPATRWSRKPLAYAQGVLLYTRDVDWICAGCERWFQTHDSPCAQDMAMTATVTEAGKSIAVHSPSLLEHLTALPSTLGHNHVGNRVAHSNGTFLRTWRRSDPVLDRHGRPLTLRTG